MIRFLRNDLFYSLIFFYFLTLHADKFNLIINGYTLRVNNLVGFILAILFFIRLRSDLFSFNKKLACSLLAIFFSIILSALCSPYKARCCAYFSWYGWTLLCYVLLPYFLIKLGDLSRIFSLYFASFLTVGSYACLQFVFSLFGCRDPFVDQYFFNFCARPNALCFEPSYYALYMTPFVFMYNSYFLSHHQSQTNFFPFRKKSLLYAVLINLMYLISTSTTVFFAYLIFIFLAFFFKSIDKKALRRFILIFCGVLLNLFFMIPFLIKDVLLKFFFHGFMTHHSFIERWGGLVNGWKIFLRHPVLGVGLGGYPCYLMEAFLKGDPAFVFFKMHTRIEDFYNPVKLFDAMNVTTELLASLGIFGIIVFSAPFFLLLQLTKRLGLDHLNVGPMMISIIVTLFVVQFNQGIFRTYLWTHFTLVFVYLENQYEMFTFNNCLAKL